MPRPALVGLALALLPGLLLVAEILWDVTSWMPANRTLAALFAIRRGRTDPGS